MLADIGSRGDYMARANGAYARRRRPRMATMQDLAAEQNRVNELNLMNNAYGRVTNGLRDDVKGVIGGMRDKAKEQIGPNNADAELEKLRAEMGDKQP